MPFAVSTHDLWFSYKNNIPVLKAVNFQVPEHAIYGLVGNNGAGKSTLLKLITGILPPRKGSVSVLGYANLSPEVYYSIGCIIEGPSLYHNMTIREHLEMLDIIFPKGDLYISELMEQTGISSSAEKKAKDLSTGQKQRLALAMALFREPELLILDEPTNGLDPQGVIDLRNLVLSLYDTGKTIICSSHALSELEKICTHIGILDNGELGYQGPANADIKNNLEDFFLDVISQRH